MTTPTASHKLWFRTSTRAKWIPLATAASYAEASALIGFGGRRGGDWLVLDAGKDANAGPRPWQEGDARMPITPKSLESK